MKLIYENCSPVPPWYPLPLLPPYEISENWHIRRQDGGAVRTYTQSGEPRVLLKDQLTGSRKFYKLSWLWRMSQTKDPVELLEMELTARRDAVLNKVLAKILYLYQDLESIAAARPTERVAILKLITGMLYNKGRSAAPSEPRLLSIDSLRKYANQPDEEIDEEEYGS